MAPDAAAIQRHPVAVAVIAHPGDRRAVHLCHPGPAAADDLVLRQNGPRGAGLAEDNLAQGAEGPQVTTSRATGNAVFDVGCAGFAAALALAVSAGLVWTLARNDCHALTPDTNALYGLLLAWTIGVLAAPAAVIVGVVVVRLSSRRLGYVAALAVAIVVAYGLTAAFLAAPPGASGTCPGNVPPWWPSWLPI